MGKKRRRHTRKKGMPPGSLVYTGIKESTPTRIYTLVYSANTLKSQEGYIRTESTSPDAIVWIDIRNLSDTEHIANAGKDFNIHSLALEDILNTQQRAKMEEYENGLFFIIQHLRLDDALELNSEQIAVFLGQGFVLSFQDDPDDTFAAVRERLQVEDSRLRQKQADYLAYYLCDVVVDHYFSIIDQLDAHIQDLENELYQNGPTPQSKESIFRLKRLVYMLRHKMIPMREAFHRVSQSEHHFIESQTLPYFRDVADHLNQMIDHLDAYRDLLHAAESFYQAEIANRMNNVMRLLAIISTIFIPLSFIAGIYGMNFDNMPELHWEYGYFIVLAFMFSAILAMLSYFRWKKWI